MRSFVGCFACVDTVSVGEYECPGVRKHPGRDHQSLGDVMAFGTYHVVGSV